LTRGKVEKQDVRIDTQQSEIAELRKELRLARQETKELRQESKELKQLLAAVEKRLAAVTSSDIQPLKDQIAEQGKQLAAVELTVAKAAQSSNPTNGKVSYAAALSQHAAAPQVLFRVTPHRPMQGTSTTPTKPISPILHEATTETLSVVHVVDPSIKPTDVRLQWTKRGAADKSKPQAMIVSLNPIDARLFSTKLRDKLVEKELQRAGWRVNIHLPLAQYQSKQALWAHFEKQLTPAVRAGKRLIYTNDYQAVQIEGEVKVMKLPQKGAAAGPSSG
jgi:hypothetical protein